MPFWPTIDMFSESNEALVFFIQERAGFPRSFEKSACQKGIHTLVVQQWNSSRNCHAEPSASKSNLDK